jgi:hypothetical protein
MPENLDAHFHASASVPGERRAQRYPDTVNGATGQLLEKRGIGEAGYWRKAGQLLEKPDELHLLGQEGIMAVIAGHLPIVGLGAGGTHLFSKSPHGIGRE